MKKQIQCIALWLFCMFVMLSNITSAQSSDEMLNLMVGKGLITAAEADSMRAEAAIKAQTNKEKQNVATFNANRLLQFSGYIQMRYQFNQAKEVSDGIDIRRARLDIRGDVHARWEYRLQLDFAGSPKILDAYAVYKPFYFLKVQVGQFKIPMSPDNLVSSSKMEFIDRSQITEALVSRSRDVLGNHNGRDIGVMLSGNVMKYRDRYLVEYFVAGFNGQGVNTTDKNESKDFTGRLLVHPVKGFDIGAAYYSGYDYFIMKPDTGNFRRLRYSGEAAYTKGRLTLKGEFMSGDDGNIKRQGYFAQAGFFIWPKRIQLLARYDEFDPDIRKGKDISSWYVGGINIFFNEYARLGINYILKNEEGGSEFKVKNDLVSAQFQIGF